MDGWPTDPRHHCRFHASLVALPPERDLLIRAKHLFVATKLSGYGPALRAQLGPVRQCPEKPLCARSAVSAGETIQAVVITQNGAIVLNRVGAAPPTFSCLATQTIPHTLRQEWKDRQAALPPQSSSRAHSNGVIGSSLAWCCLRRLRLFNFRSAQVKECPHDDRNHWPLRAGMIGCDICIDL